MTPRDIVTATRVFQSGQIEELIDALCEPDEAPRRTPVLVSPNSSAILQRLGAQNRSR